MPLAYICDHNFTSIEPQQNVFRESGYDLKVARPICITGEDIIHRCGGAEVLLVQRAPVTRRVIEAMPKLKGIVRYGIGVDVIDLEAAKTLGVSVANVPTYCLEEVSNHAIAMILSLVRRIPQEHHGITHGRWRTSETWLPAVSDMTLGLVGFGSIAKLTARKAQAFGFGVLAADPNVPEAHFQKLNVRKASLSELLISSDVVSLHCPLLASTKHMIDRNAIDAMKDQAIVVNTSRGQLIKEEDLAAALASGKLGGAGLDVFEQEPLPADSALRAMPNVILTSHSASYSTKSLLNLQVQAAQAALEFLEGRRPVGQLI